MMEEMCKGQEYRTSYIESEEERERGGVQLRPERGI